MNTPFLVPFSFMIVSYWQIFTVESHIPVREDLVPHHLFHKCDTKNLWKYPQNRSLDGSVISSKVTVVWEIW